MTVATATYRIAESFYGDSEGFFNASSTTSALVPQAFHLALGGRPYMLDLKSDIVRGYKCIGPITIPVVREQSDGSTTPGAASLNRQDAWRRVLTDWSHGHGQTWLDDSDSDAARFRTSKGINPWTKGQLSLLNASQSVATTTNAYFGLVSYDTVSAAASRYYYDTAHALFYTNDDPGSTATFTASSVTNVSIDQSAQTGWLPSRAACSAGNWIYVMSAATGGTGNCDNLYKVAGGTVTTFIAAASTPLEQCRFLAYVKGRLLLGTSTITLASKIYDCTSGTPSTAITFQNKEEFLLCASEAAEFIYVATRNQRTSTIYSMTADTDTTALTLNSVAASLPTGELINDIFGYAGILFIGTNLGFRLATPSSDGTLTLGSLVAIGAVKCFSAYGQYVWFGWSQFDSSSGGLGRIDPTVFTDSAALVPAYASDILASTTADIAYSYATTDEAHSSSAAVPHFGTSATLYALDSQNLVSSGTFNTGFATYGLTDQKVATAIDIRTKALAGTVAASLTNVYGGTSAAIDTFNATGSTGSKFPVNYVAGSEHEIVLTVTPSGTTSPVITAVTLFANPAPERGELYQLPLLLSDDVTDLNGKKWKFDPWQELAAIRAMASPALAPVVLQLGTQSIDVFIEDYENHIHHELRGRQYSSVCIVTCKNLRQQAAV